MEIQPTQNKTDKHWQSWINHLDRTTDSSQCKTRVFVNNRFFNGTGLLALRPTPKLEDQSPAFISPGPGGPRGARGPRIEDIRLLNIFKTTGYDWLATTVVMDQVKTTGYTWLATTVVMDQVRTTGYELDLQTGTNTQVHPASSVLWMGTTWLKLSLTYI
jgi:hypothetical protein